MATFECFAAGGGSSNRAALGAGHDDVCYGTDVAWSLVNKGYSFNFVGIFFVGILAGILLNVLSLKELSSANHLHMRMGDEHNRFL